MAHEPRRGPWRLMVLAWALCTGVAQAQLPTQSVRFALWDVEVDGNTRLSPSAVERVLYPFLGEGKQLADIDAARAALEAAYHQAGYLTVLVDVPPQQLRQGHVRLVVTEGRIERLKIVGAAFHSPAVLRTRVGQLSEGQVPDFNALQMELAAVNTGDDLQVSPVLRPGHTPGTVEAELKVKDQLPLHGSVELNDRGGANTPRSRLSAALRYDNLWQQGHSLSLDLTTAPTRPGDTTTWHLSYLLPWGPGQLAVYGLHSSSAVNAVGGVDVRGAGDVLGTRWYGPAEEVAGGFSSWSGGLDRKDFKQSVRIGQDDGLSYDTPIRYTPWQLQWQMLRPVTGQEADRISLALNGALRGLGSHDAQFEDNRYQGRASYVYLRASLRGHLASDAGQLVWRAEAQVSNRPLVSNEQFALGGVDSVRGYLESAWAGDEGLSTQIEWWFKPMGPKDTSPGQFTPLLFVDGGLMHLSETLPQQASHASALGAGLGLRWTCGSRWQAAVDLAHALRVDPYGHRPVRLHSRLAMAF